MAVFRKGGEQPQQVVLHSMAWHRAQAARKDFVGEAQAKVAAITDRLQAAEPKPGQTFSDETRAWLGKIGTGRRRIILL